MSRINIYIVLLTLIATLGGLLFGYDTAVISGAVGSLKAYFIDPRNLTDPNEANLLWGIVNSSALVGCIIGGLVGGVVSTWLGRRGALIIAGVLFLISALGAAAPEFPFASVGHGGPTYIWNFVLYRIISGIGVGFASVLSPMYIAEIAAMAVAIAAQWIANFIVSATFPILNDNRLVADFHHGFAYWIYGGMSILAALFIWKMVPETKGRSLEQMETLW